MTLKELLDGIDARTIPLEILEAPEYCNYSTYKAAGWTLVVFDDCHSWDYIEVAESPAGERWEYEIHKPDFELCDEEKLIHWYRPAHTEDWGYTS